MKSFSLHCLFWFVYLAQDTLLAFLWKGQHFLQFSPTTRFLTSFELCFVLLPPKILFTYFVLYVVLDIYIRQRNCLSAAAALLLSLLVFLLTTRLLEVYMAYPLIFQSQTPRTWFWSPFSFLFELVDIGYITGIAGAIKQVRRQIENTQREKLLVKEKLETELKYLRTQMHPHFLFNTLNNIYGLALKKSEKTPEVVMRLSNILRFVIYDTRLPQIKISEEIKMLEDFIDLEKIRYSRNLAIQFEKDVDNTNESIVPLLLLPFVENAFKHGAGEMRFDAFIHLYLKVHEGNLAFSVINSKERQQCEPLQMNVGLSNTRRQLELMYTDYDMEVKNEHSLFKVYLNVNLRSYESY